MENTPVSLTEFNLLIKQELKRSFPQAYWIVAEISELRNNYSGHCYLELIDKAGASGAITARMRATIWAFTYKVLSPYFESATGQKLSSGMNVLVKAQPQFHELYGLSLNIIDINPAYTLGEQHRKRQEILARLDREGLLNQNKLLQLPVVAQRIAVISSATAAGFGDFADQLENNQFGYKFYYKLFHSVMQGAGASLSVTASVEQIMKHRDSFDALVIIRGGGSSAELSCFDDYDIARRLASFPLPVIAGIGHERDETVVDAVAHTRVKTPTAAAEFLIARNRRFEERVNESYSEIVAFARNTLHFHQQQLMNFGRILPAVTNSKLEKELLKLEQKITMLRYRLPERVYRIGRELDAAKRILESSYRLNAQRQQRKVQAVEENLYLLINKSLTPEARKITEYSYRLEKMQSRALMNEAACLNEIEVRLKNALKRTCEKEHRKLELAEILLKSSDPLNLLKKGYSITEVNGSVVHSVNAIKKGDVLRTILSDGSLESKVSG